MPLDPEHKGVARAFDAFDQAVLCRRIHDQSLTESFHGLVVGRVDLQGSPLDDLFKLGACMNLNSMTAGRFFRALFMFAGVGQLRRDILIEGAGQRDVDRLRATADAEQRQVAL